MRDERRDSHQSLDQVRYIPAACCSSVYPPLPLQIRHKFEEGIKQGYDAGERCDETGRREERDWDVHSLPSRHTLEAGAGMGRADDDSRDGHGYENKEMKVSSSSREEGMGGDKYITDVADYRKDGIVKHETNGQGGMKGKRVVEQKKVSPLASSECLPLHHF